MATPPASLPGPTDRTTIIGPTGSGKTAAGLWLLASCETLDWEQDPVTVFDFKGDENIQAIIDNGGAKEISIRADPPSKPGLYVVRPLPNELGEVDAYLWKVWTSGNHGLFFDEGYMVAKSQAINAILTQGRSKRIPVIMLLQRPVWAPKFCFSEAQYFWIFDLQIKEDRDTVRSYINTPVEGTRLPYHGIWYDVRANAGAGQAYIFEPVPPPQQTVTRFIPADQQLELRVIE